MSTIADIVAAMSVSTPDASEITWKRLNDNMWRGDRPDHPSILVSNQEYERIRTWDEYVHVMEPGEGAGLGMVAVKSLKGQDA